jgi:hypothetical protein
MSDAWPAIEAVIDWCFPLVAWATVFAAVVAAILPRALAGRTAAKCALAAAAAAVVIPVEGMPLGRWLHGIDGGLSIPFLAALVDRAVETWRARPLLDRPARAATGWFGLACGLALYPAALGLGDFDPYVLGWTSPMVMLAAAAVAALLIVRGNRFGYVLLVAGLLWQLDVLESENAWDYLVDPIYFLLSPFAIALAVRKPSDV